MPQPCPPGQFQVSSGAPWALHSEGLGFRGLGLGFHSEGLGFRILGGSWVVLSGVLSPLIWGITIVTLLITRLITTDEPRSTRGVEKRFGY